MAATYNVAVFIYPGADILDFSGPIEILHHAQTNPRERSSPHAFRITTFGPASLVHASNDALKISVDKSVEEIKESVTGYDILIIPGAHTDTVMSLISSDLGNHLFEILHSFVSTNPNKSHRILLSVCTGALLLGASGVLAGRTVTTHHNDYELLAELCGKASPDHAQTTVLKEKRWVDGGTTDAGVRILTAGGVSSGIDAALKIVEIVVGEGAASGVADTIEFERRQ